MALGIVDEIFNINVLMASSMRYVFTLICYHLQFLSLMFYSFPEILDSTSLGRRLYVPKSILFLVCFNGIVLFLFLR